MSDNKIVFVDASVVKKGSEKFQIYRGVNIKQYQHYSELQGVNNQTIVLKPSFSIPRTEKVEKDLKLELVKENCYFVKDGKSAIAKTTLEEITVPVYRVTGNVSCKGSYVIKNVGLLKKNVNELSREDLIFGIEKLSGKKMNDDIPTNLLSLIYSGLNSGMTLEEIQAGFVKGDSKSTKKKNKGDSNNSSGVDEEVTDKSNG